MEQEYIDMVSRMTSEEIYKEIERKIGEFALSFMVSLDHYRLSEEGLTDLANEFNAWRDDMEILERRYTIVLGDEEKAANEF